MSEEVCYTNTGLIKRQKGPKRIENNYMLKERSKRNRSNEGKFTEAFSEPCQTSKLKLFQKINNG